VIRRVVLDLNRLFFIIRWWAHVIENPDLIKIIVFSRGTLIGLNVSIEFGGQF